MNEYKREGFTFYRSFMEAIEQCDPEEQLHMYKIVTKFALDGEEPNSEALSRFGRMCWTVIAPVLSSQRSKSRGGSISKNNNPTGRNQYSDAKTRLRGGKEEVNNSNRHTNSKSNTKNKDSFIHSFMLEIREDYRDVMQRWLSYKREIGNNYKSQQSLKAFYNELLKLSNEDAQTARKIIERSIANNWKGIFELKTTSHEKTTYRSNPTTFAGSDYGQSTI